jgi:excisionase family DNA binding protein
MVSQPAVISPRSSALFAAMLDKQLRRRFGPSSGIRPEVAAQLKADFAELRRAGDEWRASRDGNAVRSVTEIRRGSVQQEITSKEAAELLDRTDSRVRQLLRDGILPGRHDGRRWLVDRAAVVAYVGASRGDAA